MSKIKQTLENQQKINEAVKDIFDYFKDETSYAELLELMSDAQVQIMRLMEMNRYVSVYQSGNMESVPTDDITAFLGEVNRTYQLLRPFARLLGQINGDSDNK